MCFYRKIVNYNRTILSVGVRVGLQFLILTSRRAHLSLQNLVRLLCHLRPPHHQQDQECAHVVVTRDPENAVKNTQYEISIARDACSSLLGMRTDSWFTLSIWLSWQPDDSPEAGQSILRASSDARPILQGHAICHVARIRPT